MKISKFLFGSCMAGTFALSVIATWLYLPAPPPEFENATAVICAAVIAFCTGVLCYGAGAHAEAREIENRVLAQLRQEWDEKVLRRDPWAGREAGGGEDDDKPMRRAYSGE